MNDRHFVAWLASTVKLCAALNLGWPFAMLTCLLMFRAVVLESRFIGTTSSLSDKTFSDLTGNGVWGGGAVHLEPDFKEPGYHSSCKVTNCDFRNNWNGDSVAAENILGGGAIYVNFVDLTCETCHFTDCKALTGKGGGIFAHNMSETILVGCDFLRCTAEDKAEGRDPGAGGVYAHESPLSLDACNFTDCSTFGAGGAIVANDVIVCIGTSFTNAEAIKNGGAIHASGGECRVYSCDFTNCISSAAAGALYYDGDGACNFSSTIKTCTGIGTNCVYIQASTALVFEFVDIDFNKETPTEVDPFVRIEGFTGPLELLNCSVNGHGSKFNGVDRQWIVYPANYQSLLVFGGHFQELTRLGTGGGSFRFAANAEKSVTFFECVFTKNSVDANGGAISFASNQNQYTANITNCVFQECKSGQNDAEYKFGGAIYFGYGQGLCHIEGCTFIANGNNDHSGGQSIEIDCQQGTAKVIDQVVINCTFSKHAGGYPLYIRTSAYPEECSIMGCIFSENTVTAAYGLVYAWASLTWTYSNCQFIDNALGQNVQGVVYVCAERNLNLCLFEDCVFQSAQETVPHVVFCPTNNYATKINLQGCQFLQCHVASGLVLVSSTNKNNVQMLSFDGCSFEECTATSSSLLGDIQNKQAVSIDNCTFVDCNSENTNGIIYINTVDLTFRFNKFHLATQHVQPITLGQGEPAKSLVIENCTFDNKGQKVGTRFIGIQGGQQVEAKYKDVQFLGCEFQDIRSPEGAGLKLDLTEGGVLHVSDCRFVNLVVDGNGGAIATGRTNKIEIRSCCFVSCEASASCGGIYVSDWTQSGDISNCVFDSNTASSNGLCIHLVLASGYVWSRISIDACQFQYHSKGPLVYFGFSSQTDDRLGPYVLKNCHFYHNRFQDSETGVFSGRSTEGIEYQHCSFINNTCSGNGGIVALTHVVVEPSVFSDCTFEDCHHNGNGGLLFCPSGTSIKSLSLDNCRFTSCSGQVFNLASLSSLSLNQCTFYSLEGQSGLFVVKTSGIIDCPVVAIVGCDFTLCESGSTGPVLKVTADQLTLESTSFNLSVEIDHALYFNLNNKSAQLLVDQCNFSNNDYLVSNKFLEIPSEHTNVEFAGCQFAHIGSATGGGALKLSLTTNAVLTVLGCKFTGCCCSNDGGAIHGQTTPEIHICECTFDSCSCNVSYGGADAAFGGGGAIHIQTNTVSGTIEDCTFIACSSSINGQCINLQCASQQSYDRFSLTGCTFTSGKTGSLIAFVYKENSGLFPGTYSLSSCKFEDNTIIGESDMDSFGLVNAQATGGIRYNNCSFSRTYCYSWDNVVGLFAAGSSNASPSYVFSNCHFTDCSQSNTGSGIFLNSDGTSATLLSIENCEFSACHGSIIKVLSRLDQISITDTGFAQCSADGTPSVVSMGTSASPVHIQSVELVGSQLIGCGFPSYVSSSGTTILDVCSASATIDSCEFDTADMNGQGNVFPISVYLQDQDSLAFQNCTFTSGKNEIVHYIYGRALGQASESGQISCNNCTFTQMVGYWVTDNGVALYTSYPGALHVTDCIFSDISSSTNQGCGAALATSTLKIVRLYNSSFTACHGYAANDYSGGGAVYFESSLENAVMDQCVFTNNVCARNGQSFGFMRTTTSVMDLVITQCTFAQHATALPILWLYQNSGDRYFSLPVTLANCTFQDNQVSCTSGVLAITGYDLTFEGCDFLRNSKYDESTGVCLVSIPSLIGESRCSVLGCEFEECHLDSDNSALIYFSAQFSEDRTIRVEDCSFIKCSCHQSMILMLSRTVKTLTISSNVFKECQSTSSSSVLYISKDAGSAFVSTLTFDWNYIRMCTGTSTKTSGSILTMVCASPTFAHNRCELGIAESESCFFFDYAKLKDSLDILNCSFDNNNAVLEYNAEMLRFSFDMAPDRPISLSKCVLQNIGSLSQGAGIRVSRDGFAGNPVDLVLTDCDFIGLKADGSGGAVYCGNVGTLTVTQCTFEACEAQMVILPADGAGGLYVSYKTAQATIKDCIFVDNKSRKNTMSLLVVTLKGQEQTVEVTNCSFQDHGKTSMVSVMGFLEIPTRVASEIVPSSKEVRISFCNFTDNDVSAADGLVYANSAVGYVYEGCCFDRNKNSANSFLLLRFYDTTEYCRFRSCRFDNTEVHELQAQRLFGLSTAAVAVPEFELDSCEFSGIRTGAGILPSITSAKVLASPVTDKMLVHDCTFQDCSSNSGAVLNINTNTFSWTKNDFYTSLQGESQSAPIALTVNSGTSTIEHMLFSVTDAASVSSSLLELICAAGAEIDFYNCCFVHSGDIRDDSPPLFLTLTSDGTVKLSLVCFDTEKDSALSVSGNDITYDGNPRDFFFGYCYCWGMSEYTLYPDPESPSLSETQSSEESFSVPPATTSDESTTTTVPTTDEDPASGSGGKANAGLIAGVVIAVIVIIVIVIVVVLLLLRRRGTQVQSEEADGGDQELAEETVSTANATNPMLGEWSQTSEDNPIFTTETYADDNPFTNAFEEHHGDLFDDQD